MGNFSNSHSWLCNKNVISDWFMPFVIMPRICVTNSIHLVHSNEKLYNLINGFINFLDHTLYYLCRFEIQIIDHIWMEIDEHELFSQKCFGGDRDLKPHCVLIKLLFKLYWIVVYVSHFSVLLNLYWYK